MKMVKVQIYGTLTLINIQVSFSLSNNVPNIMLFKILSNMIVNILLDL